MAEVGVPLCWPDPLGPAVIAAEGLYDPCLALHTAQAPVGNSIDMGAQQRLLAITGANQGGKTTFLHALGIAQLMMQAGLPVPAQRFSALPVGRVWTHWAREEDPDLRRGKLDEELERMERIVQELAPDDLLLSNESFSSTNAQEGARIATEVFGALIESGVQVRAVTHLYDFARAMAAPELNARFLRAHAESAGGRTYRLEEGHAVPAGHGLDLYDQKCGTHYSQH